MTDLDLEREPVPPVADPEGDGEESIPEWNEPPADPTPPAAPPDPAAGGVAVSG